MGGFCLVVELACGGSVTNAMGQRRLVLQFIAINVFQAILHVIFSVFYVLASIPLDQYIQLLLFYFIAQPNLHKG